MYTLAAQSMHDPASIFAVVLPLCASAMRGLHRRKRVCGVNSWTAGVQGVGWMELGFG